jgi:hypothetical protein
MSSCHARWRRFIRQGVIDPEDIARVAAVTLIQRGHVGKGYFLTGPEALTAREQVQVIAQVTGRPIEFEEIAPHEFAESAVQRGTPPRIAGAMEALNELFRAGRAGSVTDDVQNLTGKALRTFRAWPSATPMPSVEAPLVLSGRGGRAEGGCRPPFPAGGYLAGPGRGEGLLGAWREG